ncbi:MAG: heme-binding domain-containing protein [Chitinophagaceae bacterium]|nr:heme-binding domain-containing protein [Chitinophagaceae bacterium]MDP1762403.1 heme-binding domain-containing protein [Sediminibacterium sp.]MDP1810623.1 heme-binding domain-containing protein [Sediminibacterium sp.]MDP3128595.1 heme-binding domain-containing protein [Sediminibacterium sp.]MDP3666216.1 heme-binding domain-containing protein [Sediminibacterium sp.]
MKIVKKILIGLLLVLVVLQAFRPAKNTSADTTNDISKSYPVPEEVKTILTKSCFDCHSNNTVYPWYAEIQPVAWWLNDHVKEGKREINFNEFSTYRIGRQYKKLEECLKLVKENEMPLESYTIIHKNAVLSDTEKQTLSTWFTSVRDSIKAKYPADSLILKKKK